MKTKKKEKSNYDEIVRAENVCLPLFSRLKMCSTIEQIALFYAAKQIINGELERIKRENPLLFMEFFQKLNKELLG